MHMQRSRAEIRNRRSKREEEGWVKMRNAYERGSDRRSRRAAEDAADIQLRASLSPRLPWQSISSEVCGVPVLHFCRLCFFLSMPACTPFYGSYFASYPAICFSYLTNLCSSSPFVNRTFRLLLSLSLLLGTQTSEKRSCNGDSG